LRKVAAHSPSRGRLCAISVVIGVLAGFGNAYLGIDLNLEISLFIWLLAAIIVVVVLHEGTHGAVAMLLGYKPVFGLKLPLVYVTFTDKVKRRNYMLVAIAPFVILTFLFGFLYFRGTLKLFSYLSILANLIGSVGDLWVVLKLAGGPEGAWIQDTNTGFEVWVADKSEHGPAGLTEV
jgi:hypothetical protein